MTTDAIAQARAMLHSAIVYCEQQIANEGPTATVRCLTRRDGLYWWGRSGPAGWMVRDRRRSGFRAVEFRAGEIRDECQEMLRRLE